MWDRFVLWTCQAKVCNTYLAVGLLIFGVGLVAIGLLIAPKGG